MAVSLQTNHRVGPWMRIPEKTQTRHTSMARSIMHSPSGSDRRKNHQQLWLCLKEHIQRSFHIFRIQQLPITTCDRINNGLTQRPTSTESPLPCFSCHLEEMRKAPQHRMSNIFCHSFFLPEQFLRAAKAMIAHCSTESSLHFPRQTPLVLFRALDHQFHPIFAAQEGRPNTQYHRLLPLFIAAE